MIDSKIRISQIAEAAGVSKSTVSRVLNQSDLVKEETCKQVWNAMQQLGLSLPEKVKKKAAEKRRHKDSNILLVVVPNYDNPFFTEIIKGATDSAKSHGYQILIYENCLRQGSLSELLDLIEATGIKGIISLSYTSPENLKELLNLVPVVHCCEYSESAPSSYVSVDDRSAARNATEYIISTGHRKIAFINSSPRSRFSRHRYEGFREAVDRADITIPSKWIVNLPSLQYDAAYAVITQLLSSSVIPNAIFTVSDIFAVAALNAARSLNIRVPEDLIVVGFDDVYVATVSYPSLTTVCMPKYQLGYTAAEMLQEKIISPDSPEKSILFNAKLVIRGSTSVANADRTVVTNIPRANGDPKPRRAGEP